ncbi:hypothetical protein PR048_019390 [Dryococelus australis]|uniref:Reverse transcriptase domain-containing protein n=1 Tax=Dryococelus australis TaxID=614101 RepID=A0ABQ9H3D0_9NEOP|nr:hypothetical protein PR048_019390 [Dryococelus australis]
MEIGLQIGRKLDILAYTDDVVLIGKNKEELRDMVKVLVKEIKEVVLEINIEKTKYLPISRCLVKDVVERCFEENRPRGRPILRWLDAIKEYIRKAGIPEEEWRDRALWRRLVGEAMDRLRSVIPLQ